LPSAWPDGKVKGLRAKGGFTVGTEWKNNMLTKATVLSELGGNCRIRTKIPVRVLETGSVKASGENPNTFFKTDPIPQVIKNEKVTLPDIPVHEDFIIDFQTEKGPDETLTDVNIQVKEKPTGMFSVGAGYSAIDHAVVSAQVSQQNLFGRGQTLTLKASVGSESQIYDLAFIEPWLFDMPLWSKFELWNLFREYDSYQLDTKGFGATLGYPLWRYTTGYIGYRLSEDDVNHVLPTASSYIKDQAGVGKLWVPGGEYEEVGDVMDMDNIIALPEILPGHPP